MKRKILDESLHINHLIGYQYGDRGILREESQIPEISQYIIDTFFQNESKLNCVDKSWRFPVWVALEATDIPILYIKLALGIIKRESGYAHVFKMPSFSSPSPITRWGAVSVFKSLGNKLGYKTSIGPAQMGSRAAKDLGFTVEEIKSDLGALLAAAQYLQEMHAKAKKSNAYTSSPSSNLPSGTGDAEIDITIGSYNAGHTIITKWCPYPEGHPKYKEGKNLHGKCKLFKKEDLPWTREDLGLSTSEKNVVHPVVKYIRNASPNESMGAFGIMNIEKGLDKRESLWRKYAVPHLEKKGWNLKKSMDYFYEQDQIWRKSKSAQLHQKANEIKEKNRLGDISARIKNGTIKIDSQTLAKKRKELKGTPNYIPNYQTDRKDTGLITTHGYVKEVAAEFKRLKCLDKFKTQYIAYPPSEDQLGPGYVDPNANIG
jgi:anti-sigma28 factor (negative regulator of flagellin synthesis)